MHGRRRYLLQSTHYTPGPRSSMPHISQSLLLRPRCRALTVSANHTSRRYTPESPSRRPRSDANWVVGVSATLTSIHCTL
ncbi:hypothetical protein GQ53DRAFT_733487 [Thozetella sp. PMI_491]|nr:hypothetical protein GQ53DRAFT_733487 [Thozetella sp. PMI_491]